MSQMRLVIFDVDGTLVDSQGAIGCSMEYAFNDINLPYPGIEEVRKVVGLSLHDAAKILLPEDHYDLVGALEDSYRKAFADLRLNGQLDETLFPGVREALQTLDESNILMGIATGKGAKGLKKTLEDNNLSDFFVTLQTADQHPGKPDPSMLLTAMAEVGAKSSNTLFVGDTTFDMEMAKNARIKALGVAWGYHPSAELLDHGAAMIVEGFDEVVHHALSL